MAKRKSKLDKNRDSQIAKNQADAAAHDGENPSATEVGGDVAPTWNPRDNQEDK